MNRPGRVTEPAPPGPAHPCQITRSFDENQPLDSTANRLHSGACVVVSNQPALGYLTGGGIAVCCAAFFLVVSV